MATDRNSEPGPSTSSEFGDAATEPTVPDDDVFADDWPFVGKRQKDEIIKLWNLAKVIRELGTNDQCVAFAEANGMVRPFKNCRTHCTPMRLAKSTNKSFGSWFCTKGRCRQKGKISRTNGTFFENIRIQLVHVFYLIYAYAQKWSYKTTIIEDPFKEERYQCLSKTTVCDWFSCCRESIVIYYLEKTNYAGKIGGPGKVVQIDESKFGKRKYQKGCHIEGQWVLGMIEDGSEDLRLELCPDNVCFAEVLVPLIQKHIEPGTTIHTDHWRAYDCLTEHGYIHKKVNHSDPDDPFVAQDGTQTQTIEPQWRSVKRFFKKDSYYHPENFSDAIVEFMWRRNIVKNNQDPFLEMVDAIKYVYKFK